MRVHGRTLARKNRAKVHIYRKDDDGQVEDFEFTLSALPMGFSKRCEAAGLVFNELPPQVPVVNPADKTVVIDPETRKAQMREVWNDPEWRSKTNRSSGRIDALTLVEHLRDDKQVEFDVQPPTKVKGFEEKPAEKRSKLWAAYADALIKEIEEAGFTAEEMEHLLSEGAKLQVVYDMESAISDFSSSRVTSGSEIQTNTESLTDQPAASNPASDTSFSDV